MEDPFYPTSIEIGSINGAYEFNAFAQGSAVGLQALQSLILEITCTDDLGEFDISGSAPILYITAADDPTFNGGTDIILDGAGVLSDSGGGTTDRVTFTVPKSLIPEVLGQYPKSRRGNARIYTILEDGDSYIQLYTTVNILDTSFNQTGGSTSIPVVGTGLMDTGRVEGTLTAPPANVVNENWLVGVGGTGDFATHDNEIATGTGTDWVFTSVIQGNFIYDFTDEVQKRYDGALWIDEIQITTAADVPNVPSGNLVATDVQAALNELQTELDTFPADGSITDAKLSDMVQGTVKGRPDGAGTGAPSSLTGTQLKVIAALDNVDNTSDVDKPVSTLQATADGLRVLESTITTAKFNADKLQGNDVSAAAPSNTHVLTWNGAEWEGQAPGGGGTDGGIENETNFDTDITSSEPASGDFKLNNATIGSATIIRVSTTDVNNEDITSILSLLGNGNQIRFRQIDDNANWIRFNVTSVALVTTSYDITGTVVNSGVLFGSSKVCGIEFIYTGGAGGSGVTSVFNRTNAVSAAIGDYTDAQVTNTSTVSGTYVGDALSNLNSTKADDTLVLTAGEGLTGGGNLTASRTFDMDIDGLSVEASPASGDQLVVWNGANHVKVDWNLLPGTASGISQTEAAAGNDNDQTGTTYTLVLTDEENTTIWMSNALSNTLTIPTNASVAFPIGTKISIIMEGVGVTTIAGDVGVTVNGTSAGTVVINNQYQGATLSKRAADVWIITGDIT